LENIGDSSKGNGTWYEEFNPTGTYFNDLFGTENKRDGMPDGKSSYKNEHLPPVFQHIHRRQRYNKKDMVERIDVDNVLPANLRIEAKVVHCRGLHVSVSALLEMQLKSYNFISKKMRLPRVPFLFTPMCFLLFAFAGTKSGRANKLLRHPFHIAVTEVNHDVKTKSLEISCKFFADDFEQAIEKNYKTSLDIAASKDKALLDKYIPDYISKHLSFTVDGKTVKLTYVGFQKEKEWAHCYFSVENISSMKKIDITNNLLHDFSNDQVNIIHVMNNGKRQSTTLNYPATKASFQF
jgi:hypothetical protein